MKIYSFPFALTLESSLTVAEIELLQKYDPRALALRDVTPTGEEFETFRVGYSAAEYGSVKSNGVTFVGETDNGKAGLSITIPANLKGDAVGNYINDKLATISRDVEIVEKNAKTALVNVKSAKDAFLAAIVPLTPKTVKEASDEAPKDGGKK